MTSLFPHAKPGRSRQSRSLPTRPGPPSRRSTTSTSASWRGGRVTRVAWLIYGDATTNVLAASVVAGVRRSRDIAPCASDRLIQLTSVSPRTLFCPGHLLARLAERRYAALGAMGTTHHDSGSADHGEWRQYAGPAAGWQDLMDGYLRTGIAVRHRRRVNAQRSTRLPRGRPYAARRRRDHTLRRPGRDDNSEATRSAKRAP